MKITKFKDIPQFTRPAHYRVDVSWNYLDSNIERYNEFNNLVMDPEFQRLHVWTERQQIRYIEFILRGGQSGRDIMWNCAGWMNDFRGPMYLVDGKQRIHAVQRFMTGKIPAFGTLYHEYEDNFPLTDTGFVFHVNNLNTYKEVVQWYIDLNAGGTPHTEEEIEKAKSILERIKEKL